MRRFKLDEVGYWSEIKLAIVKEYASAYSVIMAAQRRDRIKDLLHIYIDGFAGAGLHIRKATNQFIPGSPLNALLVDPPFCEYHLVDLDTGKADSLRRLAGDRLNIDVFVYDGDCNDVLMNDVFPRARYEDYRRALCILDPYGLHLDWKIIQAAGKLGTVDLFLNFPVMDMNMNVLWRQPERVDPKQAERLTRFWGDDTWRQAAYTMDQNLFGYEEKTGNDEFARAFQRRLRDTAGFKNVIEPLPMRNDQGATVYYLFFASPNATGNKIAKSIFDKYRDRNTQHG